MRTNTLLLALALGGCVGSLDANLHPTVIPKLSALPDDKRADQLDAAHARPDPEQRRRDLSPRARKLEYLAAITAAIVGDKFSHTHTVTLGLSADFDETGSLEQKKPHSDASRVAPDVAGSELVPWIHVAPAPAKTDDNKPAQPPAN